MGGRRIAAIDIGTVTTRLLVADVDGDGIAEVLRSTDITHLGEGLTVTGRLSTGAMERVGDVVARYAETMRELGVESYQALATSASRDAQNSDEFAAVLAPSGIQPVIIEGAREAELAFLGATAQLEGEGLLVVDSGGGSTELVVGGVSTAGAQRHSHIDAARSIDVGSRRMTEMFFHTDPPTRNEVALARGWAADELRGFFGRLDVRPERMFGLAGTATTLAAIKLELSVYDMAAVHGYELTGADIADLFETLVAVPLAKRRAIVGLHPERAGVIVAGTLIFETVLALAGLERMVVSEHDILYGILLDTYHDLQE